MLKNKKIVQYIAKKLLTYDIWDNNNVENIKHLTLLNFPKLEEKQFKKCLDKAFKFLCRVPKENNNESSY